MNRTYGKMMDKLLELNPSECELIMEVPMISQEPLCFKVKCLFSGQSKKMISDINDIRSVCTVKIRRSDLELVYVDTNTQDIGIVQAPTKDLKNIIEKIKVGDTEYVIVEEKDSGFSFGDTIILFLERLN